MYTYFYFELKEGFNLQKKVERRISKTVDLFDPMWLDIPLILEEEDRHHAS